MRLRCPIVDYLPQGCRHRDIVGLSRANESSTAKSRKCKRQPIVRYDAKAGERSLDVMRWGLVPFWAKDIKVGFSNINAKAEGIESKPAFRGSASTSP